jgi:hypothetical protein
MIFITHSRLIDLSNPKDQAYINLRYALYNPPSSFKDWDNHDLKELFILHKSISDSEFSSFKEIFKNVISAGIDASPSNQYTVLPKVANKLGLFKPDTIGVDFLDRIGFENRGTEFYSDVFTNILTPDTLSSEALEKSKTIATTLGFKQGDALLNKLETLKQQTQRSERSQEKYRNDVKEALKKQGLKLDEINEKQDAIILLGALNLEAQSQMLKEMTTQARIAEIKSHFNSVNDVGKLFMQLGQVTGSQDLQKFGALTIASTQVVFAAAQITGSFALSAVSGIGLITPVTAVISGGLAIFSLFSKQKNDGLAIAFKQLFSALSTIRTEMHQQFCQVHQELFVIFDKVQESAKRNEFNFLKVSDKLNAIADFQYFSHVELSKLGQQDLIDEISQIIYKIKIGNLDIELKEKLKCLDKLDYAANELAVGTILNNPDKNPANLFVDKSIEQQIGARPLDQNVAFLVNYAKSNLNISVPDALDNKPLPNLVLFFSVANAMPRLLLDIVNHDLQKADVAVKELEKLIKNNDKIFNTIKSLREDVIKKMLEIYEAEILEFNQYVTNELEAYSKALKLPANLDKTLPAIASAYTEHKIETAKGVLVLYRGSGRSIKSSNTHPIFSYEDLNTTGFGPYIMAEKLGVGEVYVKYDFGDKSKHRGSHRYPVSKLFIIKSSQENLQIESQPQAKIVDMIAEKLQKFRGDFVETLNSKNKYKEHIN